MGVSSNSFSKAADNGWVNGYNAHNLTPLTADRGTIDNALKEESLPTSYRAFAVPYSDFVRSPRLT